MPALLFLTTGPAVLHPVRRAPVLARSGRPSPPPRAPRSVLARIAFARVPVLTTGVRAAHLLAAALPAVLGDGVLAAVAAAFLLLAEITEAPVGLAVAAALTVTVGGRTLFANAGADAAVLPQLAPTALYAAMAMLAVAADPDTQLGVALYDGPEAAREAERERARAETAALVRAQLGVEEPAADEPDPAAEMDDWDARFPP